MAAARRHAITSRRFEELTLRELHDLLRLRGDVFVVEQACVYPDIDGRDTEPGTGHHWIESDGEIVAYLRTLEDGGTTRIGRVVTAPVERGTGLAGELVLAVGALVDGPLVLDAQSHLVDWYRQLGYDVDGDEFVEDGIAHVPMRRVRRAD